MMRQCVAISTLIGLFVALIILYVPKPTDPFEVNWQPEKAIFKPTKTNNDSLRRIVNSVDINDFQKLLKPILVERVVGTRGHENVKDFIVRQLQDLKWTVELDSFKSRTPNKGELEFTNIIATHNPDSRRYLVLACHYDSKLSDFVFIGATDSAVPCAMILYLAKSMNAMLQQLRSNVSLKLIFFDGEEAFLTWTATDSLYGARHLAQIMESRHSRVDSEEVTDLQRIDLLVLLDLLGATAPKFFSYFSDTYKWYKLLVSNEKILNALHLLEPDTNYPVHEPYFEDEILYGARIDDDHKPFLKRGVPCLHIIPSPFPEVWHTEDDNESVINLRTVRNLLKIFKVFILQYLSASSQA